MKATTTQLVVFSLLLIIVTACDGPYHSSIKLPKPAVIDTSRCIEVPEAIQAKIESSMRFGFSDPYGEYRIRLDKAEVLDWAAVSTAVAGVGTLADDIDGYLIGARLQIDHSWARPRLYGSAWKPLNEGVIAIAPYFQIGDLGGSGGLYRCEDHTYSTKMQISGLPDLHEAGVAPVSSRCACRDQDSVSTLAACLGYDPRDEATVWAYGGVPWLGNRGMWLENSEGPRPLHQDPP